MKQTIFALVSESKYIWNENHTTTLEFPSGLITVSTDLNDLYKTAKSILRKLKSISFEDYAELLEEKTTGLAIIKLHEGQLANLDLSGWADNKYWYSVPFDVIEEVEKRI